MKNDLLLLLGAVLLLGFAIKVAGVAAAMPELVTGYEVARKPGHTEVAFNARVIAQKPAGDGRPLLTVDIDGVEATVYVSDDVKCPNIEVGHRYQVRATVVGPGSKPFLTAIKPLALVPLVVAYEPEPVTAWVRDGYATVGNQTTVEAPGVPDGEHHGQLVMGANARLSFVL